MSHSSSMSNDEDSHGHAEELNSEIDLSAFFFEASELPPFQNLEEKIAANEERLFALMLKEVPDYDELQLSRQVDFELKMLNAKMLQSSRKAAASDDVPGFWEGVQGFWKDLQSFWRKIMDSGFLKGQLESLQNADDSNFIQLLQNTFSKRREECQAADARFAMKTGADPVFIEGVSSTMDCGVDFAASYHPVIFFFSFCSSCFVYYLHSYRIVNYSVGVVLFHLFFHGFFVCSLSA